MTAPESVPLYQAGHDGAPLRDTLTEADRDQCDHNLAKEGPMTEIRIHIDLDPHVPFDTREQVVDTLRREMHGTATSRGFVATIHTHCMTAAEVEELAALYVEPHGLLWEMAEQAEEDA